jgi:hypothetical protein
MGTFTLEAKVQYNDWKGTCAVDEYSGAGSELKRLFEATGEVTEDEILIGWSFSILERSFYLVGYYHLKPTEVGSGYYPSLRETFQKTPDPLLIHSVRAEVTLEEFLKCVKRLNCILAYKDLGIIGREAEDGR